jgi:hypothetical protein
MWSGAETLAASDAATSELLLNDSSDSELGECVFLDTAINALGPPIFHK